MKKLILLAVAVAAIYGCSKVNQTDSDNVVQFSSTSISTRTTTNDSGEDIWEANDEIGIFSSGFSTEYSNVKYLSVPSASDATESTFTASSETILYPNTTTNSSVTFNAYYPYVDGSTADLIKISIANQRKDIEKVDFMTASTVANYGGTNNNDAPVAFTFGHKLAKVTFEVECNDNVENLTDLKVYLGGISRDANYKIDGSQIASSFSNTDTLNLTVVTKESGSKATVTAILHPASCTDATTLYFVEAGQNRTYSVKFNKTLTANTIYTYSVAIGNDEVLFTGVSTIDTWNDDQSIDTSLVPEIYDPS